MPHAGSTRPMARLNIAMTEREEVEARLARLESRLQHLEDLRDIERLQRAYGYFLDNLMMEEIVELFTDDAEVEIGSRGTHRGRAGVDVLMRQILGQGRRGIGVGEVLNHLQLQGIVTVADDGSTARGRWRAFLMIGNTEAHGHRTAMLAEGLYENEYEKIGGRWRIRRLWWNPTFYWPLPGFDQAWFRSLGPSEEFPPDETRPEGPPRLLPFHFAHPVTDEEIVIDF
jgi:hypothetical protein